MNPAKYLWAATLVSLILIVVLLFKVVALERQVGALGGADSGEWAAVQESLEKAQAESAALKQLVPGLAEYMIIMQLHASKLWFAAKASNWELAAYQVHELEETMEAAKALDAEENGVKISEVLDAVLQTQVAELAKAVERKNQTEFQKAYDETVSACNGCHTEAGRRFIQIIRPTAPPVTNQRWEPSSK